MSKKHTPFFRFSVNWLSKHTWQLQMDIMWEENTSLHIVDGCVASDLNLSTPPVTPYETHFPLKLFRHIFVNYKTTVQTLLYWNTSTATLTQHALRHQTENPAQGQQSSLWHFDDFSGVKCSNWFPSEAHDGLITGCYYVTEDRTVGVYVRVSESDRKEESFGVHYI